MKKKLIIDQVEKLKGMRIAASHLAADLRAFHFCSPEEEYRLETAISLHIQCPWRIEKDDRIITGRYDYHEPLNDIHGEEYTAWDPHKDGNLQDQAVASFLKEIVVVDEIQYDGCGAIVLLFSNDAKLRLFPDGTKSEDWRLFKPNQGPHFVVSGGEIEEQED